MKNSNKNKMIYKLITLVVCLYFFIGLVIAIKCEFLDYKPVTETVGLSSFKVLVFIEDIIIWPVIHKGLNIPVPMPIDFNPSDEKCLKGKDDVVVASSSDYSIVISTLDQSGAVKLCEKGMGADYVIATDQDIIPKVEKLVPEKIALDLAVQFTKNDISKSGGVAKKTSRY